MRHAPLISMKPFWVETTQTRGILRVLKPGDERARSQGMIFTCPKCRHTKKEHAIIFIFDDKRTPTNLRPLPRFIVSTYPDVKSGKMLPRDFHVLSLYQIQSPSRQLFEGATAELTPGDLKCGWKGEVAQGTVSWKPSLWERLWR